MRLLHAAVVALLLIAMAAIIADEPASYRGPDHPIDPVFFGMHIHRATEGTAWPDVPFASWRLWDARVTWPQLEPQRDAWNFTLLDRYTEIARNHHVEILLTLGLTPEWASSRPAEGSAYAPGNAAEPRQLADWEAYVRTVALRYRGVIHAYEVWNEPNVAGTFTGNVSQMVVLSRAAYRTLKFVDPTIVVVSPSSTSKDGIPWLSEFLRQGGCRYADVIGYHLYVTPEQPEAMIALMRQVQATLRRYDCDGKPLWNTESGWAQPKHFASNEEAASYLMRTYILNALLGVQRCYWYAWDNHNWSTLDLTSPSDGRMTTAGAAYGVIHDWLLGAVLRSCERKPSGLWKCRLERGNSADTLLWSDNGEQSFALPATLRERTVIDCTGKTSEGANRLMIGAAPVLLRGGAQ